MILVIAIKIQSSAKILRYSTGIYYIYTEISNELQRKILQSKQAT